MTHASRFQIHDELTAPEASLPVLRGAVGRGGPLPNILGVLAGAPTALRAWARFRSELRNGHLSAETIERIALAVAEHRHAEPSLALHVLSARRAGLAIDDIALARGWDARDRREAALLRYLRAVVVDGDVPQRLHEAAREAGWTDEQLLEAIAVVAAETLTSLVDIAGGVPVDGWAARPSPARVAGSTA
jgi:alkylhydroperoxidase family enzyme